MEQEVKEIALEINSIFDNMPIDLLNKIPLKIRDYFKNNASNTYSFKYDKTRTLNEQNIKDKTRGIIAVLYREYICNDVEKKEFDEFYSKYLNEKDEEKRTIYSRDDIFKNKKSEIIDYEKNTNYLEVINNKPNFIKRIFDWILSILKR